MSKENEQMNDTKKPSPSRERGVKPYESPKIKTYGNIQDITLGHGTNGNGEDGSPPNKTRV